MGKKAICKAPARASSRMLADLGALMKWLEKLGISEKSLRVLGSLVTWSQSVEDKHQTKLFVC